MKKLLLLSICIFIVTGCMVEYKITINDDLTLVESVNMTGSEEFFDVYNKSSKMEIIEMLLDDEAKGELDNNNYNYRIIEGVTPYVEAYKTYNTISDFANNTIFYKQYYDDIIYQNNNGIVTLKTSGFRPNDEEDPNRYNIKRASISITCNYKVVDNNADSFNSETNTYTWYIGASDEEKEIVLSYDTNENFVEQQRDDDLRLIITIVIVIIGTWIVAIVFSKKKSTF